MELFKVSAAVKMQQNSQVKYYKKFHFKFSPSYHFHLPQINWNNWQLNHLTKNYQDICQAAEVLLQKTCSSWNLYCNDYAGSEFVTHCITWVRRVRVQLQNSQYIHKEKPKWKPFFTLIYTWSYRFFTKLIIKYSQNLKNISVIQLFTINC